GVVRPGLDVGAGASFHLAHGARLGPFVRFNWSHDPLGAHPAWLTVGLELALFGDPRHALRDSDSDGVPDPSDLCPVDPAGAHPDPRRTGCPSNDADADGVLDREDECPTVPAGAHPDRAHRGCPASDRDLDGVADALDRCPAEPGPAPTGCPVHDADGDGIPDERDACPTTQPGAHPDPERPGCPDGDDDADGVNNHTDQCRTQPAGMHPDPARPGCPLPDRDADTIVDSHDACPDHAGAPSRDPRRNGCPGLTLITQGQIRIMRPVFFATRSNRILPRSRPVLRAVADALIATPQIIRMSIEGHTDDVGDDAGNLVLSSNRAANVMAYLITEGVEPGRLASRGFGETRPLVNAPTAEARAANRRVEFRITEVEGQSAQPSGAPSAAPAP
ncbi:MAG: OmpA family protein, partial [Deltaproteobacteria bacterium]